MLPGPLFGPHGGKQVVRFSSWVFPSVQASLLFPPPSPTLDPSFHPQTHTPVLVYTLGELSVIFENNAILRKYVILTYVNDLAL